MYVLWMKQQANPKPRLTRSDWVNAGIEMLAEEGIGAVKVERLASKLGITRGSFYHHFRDREALLREMLDYWAQQWTYSIRDEISALDLEPATALLALMKAIRSKKAASFDAPFRAWALHDPLALEVIKRVDEERLGFIQSWFEALGFEGMEAENRARLYLYYEMSEPAMFAAQSAEMEEQLILERHRFLIAPRSH